MVEQEDMKRGEGDDTEKTDVLSMILKEIQRLRGENAESLEDLRTQIKDLQERIRRMETDVKLIQHEQQSLGICMAEMKTTCVQRFKVCGGLEDVVHGQ